MRRKRQRSRELVKEPAAAKQPAAIGTSMRPLLEQAGLRRLAEPAPSPRAPAGAAPNRDRVPSERAKPSAALPAKAAAAEPEAAALTPREQTLLHQAYAGVAPIARPKRGRVQRAQAAPARARADVEAERAARERLAALVGGGVRFEVQRSDEFVAGCRPGVAPKLVERLSASGFAPEAELDLHGLRQGELAHAVAEFVRSRKRRGVRYVLLITGKGLHSEGGLGVLRDAAVEVLTQGGAAPFVLAFSSAHPRHGGAGALAVLLAD
jgi:DNA-nicking Smr family endonuclease